MERNRVSHHFEELRRGLSKAEIHELEQLSEQQAQASHCKPLSGDFELCAVLCNGMSCGDFEHGKGGPWCMGLIKCKGFSGDGDRCQAFEIVRATDVSKQDLEF